MDKTVSQEIDVMRGMAALGVIAGHSLYTTVFSPLDGAFWVWIFFAMSGYLQTYFFFNGRYSLNTKGIVRFFVNRALRILPLFWLALGISFLFLYLHGEPPTPAGMFHQLFLTRMYPYWVGPLATIAIEMRFYLLAPFLCFVLKKNSESWFLLICFIFCYCLQIVSRIYWDENPVYSGSLAGNMSLFLVGIVAAKTKLQPIPLKSIIKFSLVVSTIGVAWYLAVHRSNFFWQEKVGFILAAFISYCVLAFRRTGENLPFFLKPLEFIGKKCYGVYVYSSLIGTICYHVGFTPERHPIRSFLVQLCGIPLAVVSYELFEKRIMAFKLK